MDEPVEFPITDELDLHTFRPSDLGDLIPAYLEEAQKQNLRQVRIIHGKGIGTLRTTVHSLLDCLPQHVASYRLCDETAGGWGATWVELRPTQSKKSE